MYILWPCPGSIGGSNWHIEMDGVNQLNVGHSVAPGKIIEKNFNSSYWKRGKKISLARDFCRQRATRCENVTQYYQAADTMIGCLLPRDGIWVPKIGYCYPKNTLTFGFGHVWVWILCYGLEIFATKEQQDGTTWLNIIKPPTRDPRRDDWIRPYVYYRLISD